MTETDVERCPLVLY